MKRGRVKQEREREKANEGEKVREKRRRLTGQEKAEKDRSEKEKEKESGKDEVPRQCLVIEEEEEDDEESYSLPLSPSLSLPSLPPSLPPSLSVPSPLIGDRRRADIERERERWRRENTRGSESSHWLRGEKQTDFVTRKRECDREGNAKDSMGSECGQKSDIFLLFRISTSLSNEQMMPIVKVTHILFPSLPLSSPLFPFLSFLSFLLSFFFDITFITHISWI